MSSATPVNFEAEILKVTNFESCLSVTEGSTPLMFEPVMSTNLRLGISKNCCGTCPPKSGTLVIDKDSNFGGGFRGREPVMTTFSIEIMLSVVARVQLVGISGDTPDSAFEKDGRFDKKSWLSDEL